MLMLLALLQLVGLPLLGMYLALVAVAATVRRRNALRSVSLAAISMTLCLSGALWFLDDGWGFLKSGIVVAIAACLFVFAVVWMRIQADPPAVTSETRWKALGLSSVPAVTFIGTAVGYRVGAVFPHLLSDRWGLFWGQIIGLLVGCGIAFSSALIGRRGIGRDSS